MIPFESTTVVPNDLAKDVRDLILSRPPLKKYQQDDANFYERVVLENNLTHDWFPDIDEHYTAEWLSFDDLKEEPLIKRAIFEYILPTFKKTFNYTDECYESEFGLSNLVLTFTVMQSNGHYRIHKDDEHGFKFGFIWYLSENWKWDWGGILFTIDETGSAKVKLPKFNTVVFVEHHKSKNNWHFVSRVEEYVKEPRIALLGFIK